ncbi:MAG: hypothetical protein ACOYBW_02425 [Fluviibacter phosphoraccumulans]
MKNFLVWVVLISTAALGVAVAQPTDDNGYAAYAVPGTKNVLIVNEPLSKTA